MPNKVFLTSVSHTVLAATGIFCLCELQNEKFYSPHVTYGVIVVNNLMGILWWTTRKDRRLHEAYEFTSYTQLLFALPCINAQVWVQNGYPKEWFWAWVGVPVFPFVCYIVNADVDAPLIDLIILFNLVGLGFVSIFNKIQLGVLAAVSYGLAHAYVKNTALYNCVMCFFASFSLGALGFGRRIFD